MANKKPLKPPKSKKWARRRKITFRIINDDTGHRTTFKMSWDNYLYIEKAAKSINMDPLEFIARAIVYQAYKPIAM